MTPEEDAAITAAAVSDPDSIPLTDEEMDRLRPIAEVAPEFLERWKRWRGQRGPGKKPAKVQVALRLDPEVVEKWRATGKGWQTRMGEALKRAIEG